MENELLEHELQRLSAAVDYFAQKMKEKLYKKARDGFYGWNNPANLPMFHRSIIEHVHRGDAQMVDVANLAMMIDITTRPPVEK